MAIIARSAPKGGDADVSAVTLGKLAVPPGAFDEGSGAGLEGVAEGELGAFDLAVDGLLFGVVPLVDRRVAIAEQRRLRKGGELVGQLERGAERLALRGDAVGKADAIGFLGIDRAAGHQHIERAALADNAGQAHGRAVRHGTAKAAAEDAENGALAHDAHIAPDGEREAGGDSMAFNRCNNRLVEAAAGRSLILAGPAEPDGAAIRDFLKIGTGA